MSENQNIEEKNELAVYGKFDSAESLLSAYNALQSEFTKRCQLIKQLQAELSQLKDAQAEIPETSDDRAPNTQSALGQIESVDEEIYSDGGSDIEDAAKDVACGYDGGNDRLHISEQAVLDAICANALEYAELLSAVPQIMDACIARYKRKLLSFGKSAVATTGAAVITPVRKPKTLDDAKRLADKLLNNN